MELESKLLDIEYLMIRINELEDVKRKKVLIKIERSNVENSKSLYLLLKSGITVRKMRISDHYNINYPYTQFIVVPDKELKKSKKAILFKTIEKNIKQVQEKDKMRTFKILERYGNFIDKGK